MVIVINYVIGGLSWVRLIWLADVIVRFQVSDYSQLSDFQPRSQALSFPTRLKDRVNEVVRFQPYTIISEKESS